MKALGISIAAVIVVVVGIYYFYKPQSMSTQDVGQSTGQTITAELDKPFTLKIGEEASIDNGNLKISIIRFTVDSRCPPDTNCVWVGEAVFEVALMSGKFVGDRPQLSSLNTRPASGVDTTWSPSNFSRPNESDYGDGFYKYEGYKIMIKDVSPMRAKLTDTQLKPSDYAVTFLVTK